MHVIGMGIDYTTGAPLVGTWEEAAFAGQLLGALRRRVEELRILTRAGRTATIFKGEVQREHTVDLGDPHAAGWTFLVSRDDPRREQIVRTLRPLAEHRGMVDPEKPLLFNGEPQDMWYTWLLENYSPLELDVVPHYILIVGGPDRVPFHFQAFLDSAASVGRVDFDTLEDLETYAAKLIRLETEAAPVVDRDAVIFATEDRPPPGHAYGATYFSRRYMAEPLVEHVTRRHEIRVHTLMSDEATKGHLLETLLATRPALVYTASHGLGAPGESLDVQRRYNGAICCRRDHTTARHQWLFSADDVPFDEGPFLEGAVFFQFACFGYGTPAQSDFMHWFGHPRLNAEADFVAALPRALLAHPRGPVAFIGHVDTAWLHGFADPDEPFIMERWHRRMAPFVRAIDTLLRVQPAGLAMADMNKRYDITNALLTSTYDRMQRGEIEVTPGFERRLAQTFITRSDAQNYMIFGDPAARLRIPTR